MLKFRQWLKEAPATIDAPHSEMMLDQRPVRPASKYDREKDIGGGTGNYSLRTRSFKARGPTPAYHYMAVHDDTGEVHFQTKGNKVKGLFITNETSKHPDSEISGSEFYHSILHSGTVKGLRSGSQQSEGGKHIWHQLAHKFDDVQVTHHDTHTGKKIKLHTGDDWHKNFDQSPATHFVARLKKKT